LPGEGLNRPWTALRPRNVGWHAAWHGACEWRRAGKIIHRDGKFTRVDRDAAPKALHDEPSKALSGNGVERRKVSKDMRAACAQAWRP
jgi:hypothetical protein